MGLFLLGIPCAIIGSHMLKQDIKYTTKSIRIPKADIELKEQYKQIDKYFIDILDYCGAKGDIYRENTIKKIKNTEYNCYGDIERFLALKGYYPKAISYAIKKYNNIAQKENDKHKLLRNKAIQEYEHKIQTEPSNYFIVEYTERDKSIPKTIVEQEVQQLINYFHTHGHDKAYCNIIMDGTELNHNHIEIWHLKVPSSNPKLAEQYLMDIKDKLGDN